MSGGGDVLECRVLGTGHCLARESHLIRGGARNRVECHSLVGLLRHPRHGWFLWDSGYAPRILEATRRFPYRIYRWATPMRLDEELTVVRQLRRHGLEADDIGTVIVSHFHADHLAGLRDFPRARFVADAAAHRDVSQRRGIRALARGFVPGLLPDDFADRARLLESADGPQVPPFGLSFDLFGDGLALLVPMPGHARGQLGLLARTDRGSLFFAADACWLSESYRRDVPSSRLTELIFDDRRQSRETLHRLHEFHLQRPDVSIIPTHCPEAYGIWVEAFG